MANRTTFEKTQRARAKKARADAKRARRLGQEVEGYVSVGADDDDEPRTSSIEIPQDRDLTAAELMQLVEQLHTDFEAGRLTFDEFEDRKIELMAKLMDA